MHNLKVKTDSQLPTHINDVLNFNWEGKRQYAYWLAETHRYVTHTVKLLEFSAQRLTGELKKCMEHHRQEELGHEILALNDLLALGYELEDFPELPVTKSFYETMYNLIEKDGTALIGYAMALEGISAKAFPIVTERLIKTYGRKPSSFVILHAKVDQEHSNDLTILDYLTPAQEKNIAGIITESLKRYSSYLTDINSAAEAQIRAA